MPTQVWPFKRKRFHHVAHFERVLGTSLEIQLASEREADGKAAEAEILKEIERLEVIFSRYRPGSELANWERSHEIDLPVSPDFLRVLDIADVWMNRTHLAFHPAAEAYRRVWQKGDEISGDTRRAMLTAIRDQIREPLWHLDRERGTVRRITDLPVNLNSIAKGYIADRACQVAIESAGIQQSLVNLGGDLCHRGEGSIAVGIADPFSVADNVAPIARILISNSGVATSGPAFRGHFVGGETLSHVLDPRTGYPVESVISATVVSESAALSDTLSTAFSVLQPDESIDLANEIPGVACLIVTRDGAHRSNSAWSQLLE